MADTSAIFAALDNLHDMCQDATVVGGTLEKVALFDGPPDTDLSDELMLFIGDQQDEPAVTGVQRFAQLGAQRRDEDFAIVCTAAARSGDTDMRAQRHRAKNILAGVEKLLRPGVPGSDITLRGAVLWAHIAEGLDLEQLQTPNGALAKVKFYVVCRARLN